MKTNHTPAPWKFILNPHNKVTPIFVQSGTNIVCDIHPVNMEANAKLIASAPELLEALIEAQKLIEKHLPNELTAHDQINNAIKKATE